ncbi:MAG TPA: dienelactone hydrolase family protein, partial [Methylomirabilota bacterium]|nr:dienelactone hydrolase family protein [Methylomirabilota bacterium]
MVCRLDLRRALLAMLLLLWTVPIARAAQTEIPPPQGKGRVVVVISGQSGAERYKAPAEQIAGFGYDVILLDGNDLEGSHGQALREAVQAASTSAHGLPGKVGVVGFSLGGQIAAILAGADPRPVAVGVIAGRGTDVALYWIRRSHARLYFQAGTEDEVVPHAQLLALMHAAPGTPKVTWYTIG